MKSTSTLTFNLAGGLTSLPVLKVFPGSIQMKKHSVWWNRKCLNMVLMLWPHPGSNDDRCWQVVPCPFLSLLFWMFLCRRGGGLSHVCAQGDRKYTDNIKTVGIQPHQDRWEQYTTPCSPSSQLSRLQPGLFSTHSYFVVHFWYFNRLNASEGLNSPIKHYKQFPTNILFLQETHLETFDPQRIRKHTSHF